MREVAGAIELRAAEPKIAQKPQRYAAEKIYHHKTTEGYFFVEIEYRCTEYQKGNRIGKEVV